MGLLTFVQYRKAKSTRLLPEHVAAAVD